MTEKQMKMVFSAIGFDAKAQASRHNSAGKILGRPRMQLLLGNSQYLRIRDAFKAVTDTIDAGYRDNFVMCGRQYSPIDPNTGKKRDKNQKLAWIYQSLESDAASLFATLAVERGHIPALFTHDCLYFKERLPADVAQEIAYLLKKEYPLLAFEHEAITHPD